MKWRRGTDRHGMPFGWVSTCGRAEVRRGFAGNWCGYWGRQMELGWLIVVDGERAACARTAKEAKNSAPRWVRAMDSR